MNIPIVGFAGWSGSGKTTLLIKLLPLLKARGLRIGVIKHAHHSFEIDYPGKDSYELRKAGAAQMLVASRQRWALMVENDRPTEPSLNPFISRLQQDQLDLIIVEGFKLEQIPKIEVYRDAIGKPPLYKQDDNFIAIATDTSITPSRNIVILDMNEAEDIAHFIGEHFSLPHNG